MNPLWRSCALFLLLLLLLLPALLGLDLEARLLGGIEEIDLLLAEPIVQGHDVLRTEVVTDQGVDFVI